MLFTKNTNTPGIAIFIDFRKAFDTIKWSFILSALKLFNFGSDIQNWIKVIYHNVSSCVLNNGHASSFLQLHRGVRMPLIWPYFRDSFLARALKSDDSIKGILVGEKEIKLPQFADDTTVFVRDEDSVTQFRGVARGGSRGSGTPLSSQGTPPPPHLLFLTVILS